MSSKGLGPAGPVLLCVMAGIVTVLVTGYVWDLIPLLLGIGGGILVMRVIAGK